MDTQGVFVVGAIVVAGLLAGTMLGSRLAAVGLIVLTPIVAYALQSYHDVDEISHYD